MSVSVICTAQVKSDQNLLITLTIKTNVNGGQHNSLK